MEGKININIDAALQLAKERKAKDVISSAMNAFKITKKNYLQRGILIVIILIIATVVGYTRETVNIFSESCETILNVVVAMFGTVFTGYSFFQALISEELLVRMVSHYVSGHFQCRCDLYRLWLILMIFLSSSF